MAAPQYAQRPPHTPTNVPILSPRPTRGHFPNSLSLSQSLIPSARTRKISGSQKSPAQNSPPSIGITGATHSGNTGVPAFRSLRSLLPFGPGKHPTPITPTAGGTTRSPFANFGSVRRSMTWERDRDRKNSSSFQRAEDTVISIDASVDYLGVSEAGPVVDVSLSEEKEIVQHHETAVRAGMPASEDAEFNVKSEPYLSRSISTTVLTDPTSKNSGRDSELEPHLSRSISGTFLSPDRRVSPCPILSTPSPGPSISADLSTILEAETSGISKHLPDLDVTQELDIEARDSTEGQQLSTPSDVSLLHPALSSSRLITTDSADMSAMDLSTSQLGVEVMDAMMVKDYATATEWLNGAVAVVLDESADVRSGHLSGDQLEIDANERDPNVTFNLGELDPDLAALLSPNRIGSNSDPVVVTPSRSVNLTLDDASSAGSNTIYGGKPSLIPSSSIPEPSSRYLGSQSTPMRRSLSITRLNNVYPSSLPRLRPPATSSLSPKESPGSSPDVEDFGPRKSTDSIARRPLPSPLSSSYTVGRLHPESTSRKPSSQSRFISPSRNGSSSSGSGKRPSMRHMLTSSSINPDADSVSPSSRTSSRLGNNPRPSLGSDPRTDNADRDRRFLLRSRKRSMSVDEPHISPGSISSHNAPSSSFIRPSSSQSNVRPTAEWLGPRTAKAFAAAGLLGSEHETPRGSPLERPGSRFASLRSASERDYRSPYAPSRIAFSDAGSNSSWGRSRSGSQAMDTRPLLADSPTFTATTAPRTVSTAPTSVSAMSSSAAHVHAALQSLKEKHDVETEALLAALSDSQRTTKVLRSENAELRERIDVLEEHLADARREIERFQAGLPSIHLLPRRSRAASPVPFNGQPRQSASRAPPNPMPSGAAEWRAALTLPAAEDESQFGRTHRRRASTASSLFPIPPGNMTMLLHEDGVTQSPSPPSPVGPLPRRSGSIRRGGHAQNQSIGSSVDNISPTTATFSMSGGGSPGSLFLRPEHEMHLGDLNMTSLDLSLRIGEDEEDDG